MKAAELIEGETYALEVPGQGEKKRVRYLRPSVKSAHKAWIRVEDLSSNISPEMEVPKRRLVAPWNTHRADSMTLVDTDAFRQVAWLPKPGEEVECDDTGALRWTVTSVDLKAGEAIITSTPFTRFQARMVLIERLQPAAGPPAPNLKEQKPSVLALRAALCDPESPKPQSATLRRQKLPPSKSSNARPGSVADRLLFSESACQQYKRHVEPKCRKGDEAKRMRREIRKNGRTRRVNPGAPGYRRGEYLRYRVPGRFEVILFGSPQAQPQDIYVKQIKVLGGSKRSRRRRKRRR